MKNTADDRKAGGDLDVLLAGATGLVGRWCLKEMGRDDAFGRLIVPTRRTLPDQIVQEVPHEKLEEHVVDFGRLRDYSSIMDVDVVVCALGTTIKQAGSKEAFREVDYGYPVTIAEMAKARGARHYLIVSAIGADPGSMFFYNRVKGEVERRLRSMNFESLTIVRPSLLLGDRDELRIGEEVAKRLSFLIPRKYKPVHAAQVAQVLVNAAKARRPGVEVIESREILSRTEKP